METPPIPDWIRTISHPSYRNVFSFNLGNTNLWGTETLLGDWSGRFLLVAKDFYPSAWIEDAVKRGQANPYSHNPSAPTNEGAPALSPGTGPLQAGLMWFPLHFRLLPVGG